MTTTTTSAHAFEAVASTGLPTLPKAPTGIRGLDVLTGGGLPRGRPTLVCGAAGSGKTLLAMEFLVRGITDFHEPGVFVAFEETRDDLVANVASLGFDLVALERDGTLVVDHVSIVATEVVEAGGWDLEGLFIRLGAAIDKVGAKRVAIDTIETLFGAFTNVAILRAELKRLFVWLKARGVTVVITGERGDGALTRHGIEEYVSDCVIVLDHLVSEDLATRRLRILKYRGSLHGANQYPFLIGERGISVQPITSLLLQHAVFKERVSTGVDRLDLMLGGGGPYRGSSVLVSGTAGTGKSTLAAQFCDAACDRGERAIYFAFEESAEQIIRNMGSVGLHLQRWAKSRGGARTELFDAASTPPVEAADRELWITQIRRALDNDRFELHAQPIVELATGDVVQHELLLRMRGDDDELIPPLAFLPTAERCGLIAEIDQWVITEATKLAACGTAVGVNLSAMSAGDPRMLALIERQLQSHVAKPSNLVFEITETAVMQDMDRATRFAERLIALGCRLSLDDFGTGFASFTYLKRLPVHYLKIDIEFVRDVAQSQRDMFVVRAIVALANDFGQQTIAEGVENQQTADVLRDLGVTYAQGHLFGRPEIVRDSTWEKTAMAVKCEPAQRTVRRSRNGSTNC